MSHLSRMLGGIFSALFYFTLYGVILTVLNPIIMVVTYIAIFLPIRIFITILTWVLVFWIYYSSTATFMKRSKDSGLIYFLLSFTASVFVYGSFLSLTCSLSLLVPCDVSELYSIPNIIISWGNHIFAMLAYIFARRHLIRRN